MGRAATSSALRWIQRAVRLLEWIAGLTLGALLGVVLLQVSARFVLHASVDWTIDVATILLVWATFLGATVASFADENFAVSFLVGALPPAQRRVAELFANVAVIVILVALLIYGSRYTVIQTSQLYPGIAISKAWGAIAIPVSAMLMLPRYVLAAIGELSGAGQTRREQDRASRVAGAAEFTASHGGSQ